MCTQSVGLLSRALQMEGIASVMTSWRFGVVRMNYPPRATMSKLPRGSTLGLPGDSEQQRRVLEATLALFAQDAPITPIMLDEEQPEAE